MTKAREWRTANRQLRVLREKSKTIFALTAKELDQLLTDYAAFNNAVQRDKLKTARVRIGICAGRMESCNETPQKHELVSEVRAWEREMRDDEILS